MGVIHAKHARPLWPGIVGGSRRRRFVEQFEVHDAPAAVSQRGPNTVGTGVASADHDHVLVPRSDVLAIDQLRIEQTLGVAGQEVHREMDALQIPAGDGQIARPRRAGGQQQGIELILQLPRVEVADFQAPLLA